jgi:AAA domain
VADTRRVRDLTQATRGARYVFVGDPEQARPIGAAGWYHDATAEHGVVANLTKVHRQLDPEDRRVAKDLRAGRSLDALNNLDRRGRLHVAETTQDTLDNLVDDYLGHLDAGRSPTDVRILTSWSNSQRDELNRAIQVRRTHRGDLPRESVTVEATRTGGAFSIHAGDPVMFIAATRAEDGRHLANGVSGTATAIDPATRRVTVALDDDTTTTVRLADRAPTQPLAPAYAVHVLKYQGGENAVTLYVAPPPGQLDKGDAYSALTRGREETHVYLDEQTHGTDAKDTVADELLDSAFKRSAASVAHEHAQTTARAQTETHEPDRDRAPEPARSARSVIAEANQALAEEATARAVQREEMRAQARDEARVAVLTRVVGPQQAQRVRNDPSYATALAPLLHKLEVDGADAKARLAQAARQRELETARYPARVLAYRLDQIDVAERRAAASRSSEPTHPKSWVDHDIDKINAQPRRPVPPPPSVPVERPVEANHSPARSPVAASVRTHEAQSIDDQIAAARASHAAIHRSDDYDHPASKSPVAARAGRNDGLAETIDQRIAEARALHEEMRQITEQAHDDAIELDGWGL